MSYEYQLILQLNVQNTHKSEKEPSYLLIYQRNFVKSSSITHAVHLFLLILSTITDYDFQTVIRTGCFPSRWKSLLFPASLPVCYGLVDNRELQYIVKIRLIRFSASSNTLVSSDRRDIVIHKNWKVSYKIYISTVS